REKPAGSSGHRSRSNDEASVRGPHQDQQSIRTASTGRTHDCKRPLCCTPKDLLPGGGHPHMIRRREFTLLGGAPAWSGTCARLHALAQRNPEFVDLLASAPALRKFSPRPLQRRIVVMIKRLLMSVSLALVPGISFAQSIDQNVYYKLSTQFRGSEMKLDVFNGGPKNNMTRLEPDQDVAGQFWRFAKNPDGTFRLTTVFRGPNVCLDIFNGGSNNNQPQLARADTNCGQYGSVLRTVDDEFAGFNTQCRCPGLCLDILNGGQSNKQPLHTKCNDFAGQISILTKTETQVAATATG